jgi:hypothetical protein
VNLGGEPERDDSGLPPVDIEIPDDARELDRDVQAYRRELRALRRHQRRLRRRAPFTRDGVVLPLLASCLVLALIAGTLLTVFAGGPGNVNLPGAPAARTAARSAGRSAGATSGQSSRAASVSPPDSPTAVPAGPRLPAKSIEVNGKKVPLRKLMPAVFALAPLACGCAPAVRRLVSQASAARVPVYLVSDAGQLAADRRLAAQVPGQVTVVRDASGVLSKTYPHAGLTALLVHPDGTVRVAKSLEPGLELGDQLRALRVGPLPSASPRPSASAPPGSAPPGSAPSSGAPPSSGPPSSAPPSSAPPSSPQAPATSSPT